MEYVEYVEYVECVECVECVEYHQSGTVCDGESVEKGVGCFDFGNSSRGVLGGYMRVMRVCMRDMRGVYLLPLPYMKYGHWRVVRKKEENIELYEGIAIESDEGYEPLEGIISHYAMIKGK